MYMMIGCEAAVLGSKVSASVTMRGRPVLGGEAARGLVSLCVACSVRAPLL